MPLPLLRPRPICALLFQSVTPSTAATIPTAGPPPPKSAADSKDSILAAASNIDSGRLRFEAAVATRGNVGTVQRARGSRFSKVWDSMSRPSRRAQISRRLAECLSRFHCGLAVSALNNRGKEPEQGAEHKKHKRHKKEKTLSPSCASCASPVPSPFQCFLSYGSKLSSGPMRAPFAKSTAETGLRF